MPRLTPADEATLHAAGYAACDIGARRWCGCEGYALPAAVALAHARADLARRAETPRLATSADAR